MEHELLARNAENLRVSLLGATLDPLLSKAVGHALDKEELRQLQLARTFLYDVVAGAKLVTKGESGSVSARRAVQALGYALGPLEAIKRVRLKNEDEVLTLFNSMLDAVDESIHARKLSGDQDALRTTADLFRYLHEAALSTVRHRTGTRWPGKPLPVD